MSPHPCRPYSDQEVSRQEAQVPGTHRVKDAQVPTRFSSGFPGNGPNPAGVKLSDVFSVVTSDQKPGAQTPTRLPSGTLPRDPP